jgi:UDP-N-acetylmuramyl pentapeptide phosphotransferase/UDP-N-acetylglucosamine-1-phosphate transferase
MWFILMVILFICFYEMIYSGIQRIMPNRDCNELVGNPEVDGIIIFISRLIGLLLWTWPLIYVYWAKEYIMRWFYKGISIEDDDEEVENINEYFQEPDNSKPT